MSCATTSSSNVCGILQINPNTAKIFIKFAQNGCSCSGACQCKAQLTMLNTHINIRRDGPKYSPSYGCCGNPVHRVQNCPILPGQLSYPFPTYIVPCPDPVAPPFFDCKPTCPPTYEAWYYKFPPFVRYPLFSKKLNELCFFLDDLFYQAPRGRYVADLFINEAYCSSLRLQYNKSCHIESARAEQFNQNPCADLNPAPHCVTPDCG